MTTKKDKFLTAEHAEKALCARCKVQGSRLNLPPSTFHLAPSANLQPLRSLRPLRFRGFTLVEIMVVLAIFTIMIGAIYTAFGSGRVSYYTQETQISVQQEIRKALTRMTKELRQAGSVTISTTLSANDTITFQIPSGFGTGGNINWSSNIRYRRGGLNNSQVLRTKDGQTEVLANNVSALSFSSPSSDIVTISVTASKTIIPLQLNLASSQTARVRLRN